MKNHPVRLSHSKLPVDSAGPGRSRWARWVCGVSVAAVSLAAMADTLRLPSGEVLLGTVIEQSSTTLTFDSKGLGRISVPAAGVEVLRDAPAVPAAPAKSASTPAPTTGGAGPSSSAEPPPPTSWLRQALHLPAQFSGSIEAGADMMNSDSKMRDYVLEASFGWKTDRDEYATHHAYEKVTVNGTTATDTHDESVRWIRHLDPRWMLLTQADWRHDETQGVRYRTDLIAIPAFYVVKNDRWSLLGGVGPSYEWRQWTTTGAEPFHRFNAAAYEVLRIQLTKSLALRQTFLGYDDPKHTDDYRYVFTVNLRQRLPSGLSVSLNYDRRHDSRPAPRAVTDQDRVVTKFGYEF